VLEFSSRLDEVVMGKCLDARPQWDFRNRISVILVQSRPATGWDWTRIICGGNLTLQLSVARWLGGWRVQ